jgi:hypothetical protein
VCTQFLLMKIMLSLNNLLIMNMECGICTLMVHVKMKEMEHALYYTLMLVKFIIFPTY